MTPTDFAHHMQEMPAEAALIFETDSAAIAPGYHVTEWKLAQIDSIDCGARQSRWSEARLQLLDGYGTGRHMSVGRFRDILAKSIAALPQLGDSPFTVEFAPGNAGLRVFDAHPPVQTAGQVHVRLTPVSAACKPMLDAAPIAAAACCGPTA